MAASVPAPRPAAGIAGTVVDETGAVIPGASVTVNGQGQTWNRTTDSAGHYATFNLPAGTYTVTVRSNGFQTQEIAGVAVRESAAVGVNATLKVANAVGMAAVSGAAPRPTRTGAGAAVAASPAPAPAPAPTMAQMVTAWINGLPSGSVQYFVKDKMTLNVPATATATIYPPGVAAPTSVVGTESAPPGAGASVTPAQAEVAHALKVATYMRVDLTQEDNPGTFKIDPAQGECKLVLTDRPTEWSFQVTPVEGGSGKKLTFTAYAVYGADASSCSPGNPAAIPLPVDKRTVNVAEFNVRNAWQRGWDTFWGSPWKWLLSILPGGAAFARIGTIRDWWEKRKKPVVKGKD
jgi:hypothetical protein